MEELSSQRYASHCDPIRQSFVDFPNKYAERGAPELTMSHRAKGLEALDK
jgi:hypothetical protein